MPWGFPGRTTPSRLSMALLGLRNSDAESDQFLHSLESNGPVIQSCWCSYTHVATVSNRAWLLSSPLYTLKCGKLADFQHAGCVDSSKESY
jgi:hypothetical protein